MAASEPEPELEIELSFNTYTTEISVDKRLTIEQLKNKYNKESAGATYTNTTGKKPFKVVDALTQVYWRGRIVSNTERLIDLRVATGDFLIIDPDILRDPITVIVDVLKGAGEYAI